MRSRRDLVCAAVVLSAVGALPKLDEWHWPH